jgi:uncharacterized membrane protein
MIGFVVLLAISLTPSSSKAAPFVAQADEVIVYAMPYETTGFSTWVADSYATHNGIRQSMQPSLVGLLQTIEIGYPILLQPLL